MICIGGLRMKPETNEIKIRRVQVAVSHVGAKVADAIEASQQAKFLSAKSEALLINAQQELEEIYMSIESE